MAHVSSKEPATPFSSTPLPSPSMRQGNHERLFRLLEELGPAPEGFMLGLSDPMLTRENIFEDEDDA